MGFQRKKQIPVKGETESNFLEQLIYSENY